MPPAFTPEYVLLSCGSCPLMTGCGQYHPFTDEIPRPPRPRLLELPPQSSNHSWEPYFCASSPFHDPETHSEFNSLYPLNLISTNLTCQQRISLWDIGLHPPIHIHTPTAHIGTICTNDDIKGYPSHNALNAVDVYEFLRSFACAPLELSPTFAGLPPIMKTMVQDAFYARTSGPGRTLHLAHCDAIWSRFIYGCLDRVGGGGINLGTGIISASFGPPASPPPFDGRPLGRDLLLGNCNVWGFERASFAGYDVVHLG